MLRTNIDKLVKNSVVGEITHPAVSSYRVTPDGRSRMLPGTGGITYNIRVGDIAVGWEADHVEPAVTIKNSDNNANSGLNTLSCVGNEAVVISGDDAKGEKGVVVGKHGGAEHVMIDVPLETMEKLLIGDKFMVKSFGIGLKLLDFPEVTVMNVAPNFLEALSLEDDENGNLVIPVTHEVPGAIMGSGLGGNNSYRGDYDIQMFDEEIVEKYGLEDLRFGDLVALLDTDNTFGPIYKTGAVTIGIIVHSDCVTAGHGPGVTRLFTSSNGKIVPKIDPDANIAKILNLR
ncbi:TPA: DUF4438 domain-containing protein [Candidatus Poribacteria bacterium]|nr:DUF4438 domain-containing protein [Candidatus Poribacteria bacterium]